MFPLSALRYALSLLGLVLGDGGGDLVRNVTDVRLIEREVDDVRQSTGHLGAGDANRKNPDALPSELTGDR